jgi:hypothetical protein
MYIRRLRGTVVDGKKLVSAFRSSAEPRVDSLQKHWVDYGGHVAMAALVEPGSHSRPCPALRSRWSSCLRRR